MKRKTLGESEAEFTKAVIKLEREYFGRGPSEARSFFITDMIVVRLRGILTPAEVKLSETEEGRKLVKNTRRRLFQSARPLFENLVQDILGCEVINLYTDMSVETAERVIILTVDANLDDYFS
jgi:uncharacterized protein YbcI